MFKWKQLILNNLQLFSQLFYQKIYDIESKKIERNKYISFFKK